jgi:hypothetical protein
MTIVMTPGAVRFNARRNIRDRIVYAQLADDDASADCFAFDSLRAWIHIRESTNPRLIGVHCLGVGTLAPVFFIFRAPHANASQMSAELAALRSGLDLAWRDRARIAVTKHLPPDAPTRLRIGLVLGENGRLKSAAHYCALLPTGVRRSARIDATGRIGSTLHMKEALDWATLLRVAACRGIGCTLEECVRELGGSLRTFRRVRHRLSRWIDVPPKALYPQMVIDALADRVAPLR